MHSVRWLLCTDVTIRVYSKTFRMSDYSSIEKNHLSSPIYSHVITHYIQSIQSLDTFRMSDYCSIELNKSISQAPFNAPFNDPEF